MNVDVRDVARAHVLALKLPPSSTPKRFILSTSMFTLTDVVALLAEKRPELKERLPVITGREPPLGPVR
jgi:nucleoside-diphosphate-sugar epimerase